LYVMKDQTSWGEKLRHDSLVDIIGSRPFARGIFEV
jgi:hypothetical protein